MYIIPILFIIPSIAYGICKYTIKLNTSITVSVPFAGTGTIYSSNSASEEFPEFRVGMNISDYWNEISYKETYCLTYQDDYEYCMAQTLEECQQDIPYCLVSKDDSYSSCENDNWVFEDEDHCNQYIDSNNMEEEYKCEIDKSTVCKKKHVLRGDYTTDYNQLDSFAYYRYDVENFIIKASYVCFETDKQYCLKGDNPEEDYEYNKSIILQQNNWFQQNIEAWDGVPGYCEIRYVSDNEELDTRCYGIQFGMFYAKKSDIAIDYFKDGIVYSYCIYESVSCCPG